MDFKGNDPEGTEDALLDSGIFVLMPVDGFEEQNFQFAQLDQPAELEVLYLSVVMIGHSGLRFLLYS